MMKKSLLPKSLLLGLWVIITAHTLNFPDTEKETHLAKQVLSSDLSEVEKIELRTTSTHFFAPPPPANDDLCNATAITIDAACTTNIDLSEATAQTNEPDIQCAEGSADTLVYNSVWYSFVATADPVYIVAEVDSIVFAEVFQMNLFSLGGDCADLNNLQLVECELPNGLITGTAILTTLTAGTTYYVQVSGITFIFPPGTPSFAGSGCFSVRSISAPANDDVCDAVSLNIGTMPMTFSNLGATAQAGEAAINPPPASDFLAAAGDGWSLGSFIDNSVWFSFTTGAVGGNYVIDFLSSINVTANMNVQAAVYSATDCNDFGSFSFIAGNDNYIPPGFGRISVFPTIELFCLPANTTYYLLVDGGNTIFGEETDNQGRFSVQINESNIPISTRMLAEGPDCPGGNDGTLLVAAEGGGGEFTYKWNTGDSIPAFRNAVPSGEYIVSITDQCGEQIIDTIMVPTTVKGELIADAGSDILACKDEVITLRPTVLGGLALDSKRLFAQSSLDFPDLLLTSSEPQRLEVKDTINKTQSIRLSEMEFIGDQLYGLDFDNRFYAINTTTGDLSLIDSIPIPGRFVDLSYVTATEKLYALTDEGRLYTLNPATTDTSFVLDTGIEFIWQAAVDNNETLYLLDFDSLVSVNINTGNLNKVAAFPITSFGIRSMEVDPSDDKIYLAVSTILSNNGGRGWQELRELNKTNGNIDNSFRDFTVSSAIGSFAIKVRTEAPYEFAWSPSGMLSDTASSTPSFTLTDSSSFSLVVMDACASSSGDMIAVNLSPDVTAMIDTSIAIGNTYKDIVINADTVIIDSLLTVAGCDSILTVNVTSTVSTYETYTTNAVKIQPNPATTSLQVLTEGIIQDELVIRIRDVSGRILFTTPLSNENIQLNIATLQPGYYLLELRGEEKFAVRRFVKM